MSSADPFSSPLSHILGQVPEKFSLLDNGIDEKLQSEYFDLSEKLGEEEHGDAAALIRSLGAAGGMEIKEVLIRLAQLGTPEAHVAIEKYMNESAGEMEGWAVLALQECRMNLESLASELNDGILTAGLGGTANRVRYFVAVPSGTGNPFSEAERKIIAEEFALVCRRYDTIFEKSEFTENYAALYLLVPYDVSLESLIKAAVAEACKKEKFISDHFLATNARRPSPEEIIKMFEEAKSNNKTEPGTDAEPQPE
jgi:hypothetical protein